MVIGFKWRLKRIWNFLGWYLQNALNPRTIRGKLTIQYMKNFSEDNLESDRILKELEEDYMHLESNEEVVLKSENASLEIL